MATLPPTASADPTFVAIEAAIENINNLERPRPYLGMSGIGEECERCLFYQFRWCLPAGGGFDAKSLLNFEDGHRTEDLMATRLRMVPGVDLYTLDPGTGRQFGWSAHGGHFRGHIDGAIRGIIQAPKAWHIWENKASEKGPAELAKAKADLGEKQALAKWNPTYFAQAVLYMHYGQMERHYLTCTAPGGRLPWTSVRTNADPEAAARFITKAERIIFASTPPVRLSEDPAFWKCKGCPGRQVCHTPALPRPNCRNCLHATPERDGDGRWSCAKWGADIPLDAQAEGCKEHLFIPALLSRWGEQIDADAAENSVTYRAPDGLEFRNGKWAIGSYTSKELHAITPPVLRDSEFLAIRERTNAQFVDRAGFEEAA